MATASTPSMQESKVAGHPRVAHKTRQCLRATLLSLWAASCGPQWGKGPPRTLPACSAPSTHTPGPPPYAPALAIHLPLSPCSRWMDVPAALPLPPDGGPRGAIVAMPRLHLHQRGPEGSGPVECRVRRVPGARATQGARGAGGGGCPAGVHRVRLRTAVEVQSPRVVSRRSARWGGVAVAWAGGKRCR